MSYRRSLLVLSVFLVTSMLLTWAVLITLERGISGTTNKYSAVFTDVSGLRVGDDVRMAGVRVGRVEAIDLEDNLAVVDFKVQDDQVLTGNTAVSVTYQNAIGQRYLGLARGDHDDPAVLKPGARIPIDRTEPSFDISKLLNGFEPLFSTLDPTAVDNITEALIKALQGDSGSITVLIAESSRLAETFAGPDEVLGQVINNLAAIVDNLAKQSGNLTTVIEQTRSVFEGLQANQQTLFDSVDQISSVVGRASEIVESSQPTMREFLQREPGYSQHFLDNKYKFEYFGFNIPFIMKGLARMSQAGGYVDAYVCDVTMSYLPGLEPLMPALTAALTPGGVIKHTSKCR